MNIYQENGFEDRIEYLECLADEAEVDIKVVCMLADLLGPEEDFDGLVAMVDDYRFMH